MEFAYEKLSFHCHNYIFIIELFDVWFCNSLQSGMNVNIIIIFPAGKLQKAEYILSSLINNSGATGRFLAMSF